MTCMGQVLSPLSNSSQSGSTCTIEVAKATCQASLYPACLIPEQTVKNLSAQPCLNLQVFGYKSISVGFSELELVWKGDELFVGEANAK